MRLLRTIIRGLIQHPRFVWIVDDQRSWRGLDLLGGAFHVARAIKQTTSAPHVGLMLPTSGLFPMSMIATWMLGRTVVPLNYLLKPRELEYVLDDAGLDTVVTVTPMVEHVGGLPERIRQIRLD